MAKKYRFFCNNQFGENACEIGKKGFPANQLAFTRDELRAQDFPPKCPKCREALEALDPLPADLAPGAEGAGQADGRTRTGDKPVGLIAGIVLALVVVAAAAWWLMRPGPGEISGLPRSVEFGTMDVGSAVVREIQIKNTGSGPLKISKIMTSHPEFQSSDSQVIVPPGSQKTIRITFAGTQKGLLEGKLQLASNDKKFPEVSLPLRGSTSDNPWKILDEYYENSTIIDR